MSSLRSMSSKQAVSEATSLAASFLAGENANGFTSELDDATPDLIETEKQGKVQRYWIALVGWHKNGAELDGPAVISIDLLERKCNWA